MAAIISPATPGDETDFERTTYAKVTRRLLPFLIVCYVVAYLDRVNVSLAKLQMLADLHMSEAAYGFGAGIFFIGYFIFEVPSNLILHRVGARIWIARIMVTWGIIAGAMAYTGTLAHVVGVRPDIMFYALRFLLGMAEAGFFPGLLLYLTYWYPPARQARMVSLLMSAQPVAFIVGAPLSGFLMSRLAGVGGIAGWRWMFVVEAAPAVLLGILVAVILCNGPAHASWLAADEKRLLADRLRRAPHEEAHASIATALALPFVWMLFACWFLMVIGVYGINFWLPSIIKGTGHLGVFAIGLLTAIPYLVTAIAMNVVCRIAEPRGQKRRFLIVLLVFGGLGLVGSAYTASSTVLTIACITVAMSATMSASALFWSLPGERLTGAAVAATLAAINSVGNLGGFAGPYLLGALNQSFGSNRAGLTVLGLCLVAASALALLLRKDGGAAPRTAIGFGKTGVFS